MKIQVWTSYLFDKGTTDVLHAFQKQKFIEDLQKSFSESTTFKMIRTPHNIHTQSLQVGQKPSLVRSDKTGKKTSFWSGGFLERRIFQSLAELR